MDFIFGTNVQVSLQIRGQLTQNHFSHILLFISACDCNKYGTRECDATDGTCICKTNVEGKSCDKCANGFYGNLRDCQSNFQFLISLLIIFAMLSLKRMY